MNHISRRHLLLASVAVAAPFALAGCTSDHKIKDSAQAFAEALTNLDLSKIRVYQMDASHAQDSLMSAVRNLTGAEPTVTVQEVNEDEKAPSAKLKWSWKIPGVEQRWEYETNTAFGLDGERWNPIWNIKIVHNQLSDEHGLALELEEPTRGQILGADNAVVVKDREIQTVGLDKSKLTSESEQKGSATALAKAFDLDTDSYVQKVKDAGKQQFVEAIVLRQAEFEKKVTPEIESINGFLSVEGIKPLAPSANFAPDILGTVGEATADDVKNSHGKIASGAITGHGGLQQRFNDQLAGSRGYVTQLVKVDSAGAPVQHTAVNLHSVKPVDGKTLNITLNPDAQQKAVDILADQDSPSAIVALRVATGEILVAANGEGSNGFSTALQAQYAPGSTFKVATSLALLRKGMTPESKVNCSESVEVDGQTFKNASSYPQEFLGTQTLTTAVAHSCNTAFINERDKVSQEELKSAAESLGIGLATDLGVDAFFGNLPDSATEVEHAASMIGQGKILVSPLAMAVVAASVARQKVVVPVLVKDQSLGEAKVPNASLTSAETQQLQTLMRAVVTEGGLTELKALSPNTAYGKTGTAEYGDAKPPKTHSWVIAVHQDIAVAVVVEDGDLGSITGTPLALETFKAL